jgi:hypothetical protein
MDGFAQGSIVVVDVLQLFVLWGWLGIPGGRSFVTMAIVTIGMLILLASIVLFHHFQEKRTGAKAMAA